MFGLFNSIKHNIGNCFQGIKDSYTLLLLYIFPTTWQFNVLKEGSINKYINFFSSFVGTKLKS